MTSWRRNVMTLTPMSWFQPEDISCTFFVQMFSHGCPVSVFKFPSCVCFPHQSSIKVFSASGDPGLHKSINDYVFRQIEQWKIDPDVSTQLCRYNGQVIWAIQITFYSILQRYACSMSWAGDVKSLYWSQWTERSRMAKPYNIVPGMHTATLNCLLVWLQYVISPYDALMSKNWSCMEFDTGWNLNECNSGTSKAWMQFFMCTDGRGLKIKVPHAGYEIIQSVSLYVDWSRFCQCDRLHFIKRILNVFPCRRSHGRPAVSYANAWKNPARPFQPCGSIKLAVCIHMELFYRVLGLA